MSALVLDDDRYEDDRLLVKTKCVVSAGWAEDGLPFVYIFQKPCVWQDVRRDVNMVKIKYSVRPTFHIQRRLADLQIIDGKACLLNLKAVLSRHRLPWTS